MDRKLYNRLTFGARWGKCSEQARNNFSQYVQKLKEENAAQIKELEQKLEQTEKDLADYQFNYPSIRELSKENAELKRINSETISQLNLDNGELIIKVEQLENDKKELLGIIQGKDKVIKQAKEIIKGLLSCARNYPEGNLEKMQRAENFLKE